MTLKISIHIALDHTNPLTKTEQKREQKDAVSSQITLRIYQPLLGMERV